MLLGMPFRPLLLALAFALPCAAPAAAMVELPDIPQPVAGDPADGRAAETLISLLLAPDVAGNPQALARRMGIEELIWDCGYWGAGMTQFSPYPPCYSKSGKLRKHVDKTTAHRDHVHIGMGKAGAAGRTSFWSRGR